jgi:hypothetical protein
MFQQVIFHSVIIIKQGAVDSSLKVW